MENQKEEMIFSGSFSNPEAKGMRYACHSDGEGTTSTNPVWYFAAPDGAKHMVATIPLQELSYTQRRKLWKERKCGWRPATKLECILIEMRKKGIISNK